MYDYHLYKPFTFSRFPSIKKEVGDKTSSSSSKHKSGSSVLNTGELSIKAEPGAPTTAKVESVKQGRKT